jgi:YrbI family 3-deoxy-D-manno-octulosonate 8-phosphate phosphatase
VGDALGRQKGGWLIAEQGARCFPVDQHAVPNGMIVAADDGDRTPVLAGIRLVVSDFDGVMTDGRVLVFDDGREAVWCTRSDGLGCDLLRHAGIEVLILSTERNPVVAARAGKLDVGVIQGCADKGAAMRQVLAERGLRRDQVAYVGNDVNDLPAFAEVDTRIAPSDAHRSVLELATIVTQCRGGDGVLREVADIVRGGG